MAYGRTDGPWVLRALVILTLIFGGYAAHEG
jgi:hypothetical protein